ncbi:MAG: hypothetical protein HY289_05150, partial [Planctomycetes bacterium]|nr:hypothetical protein [Planctomycetota bacterium]
MKPALRDAWRAEPLTFQARGSEMYNILGSIALAYLAVSGTVTNSSVVGRG